MRFASLGSGSRGNATLIESASCRLLLDCGFAAREVEGRLEQLGVAPDTLDAILVTHEHQDHIRGVGAMARRYSLPVWLTYGTHRKERCGALPEFNLFHSHQGEFLLGDILVRPFAVPHDASEPVQYLFKAEGRQLGVLTDTGMVTPHIVDVLQASDSLLLECNHDTEMLRQGPYPFSLQQRVGGNYGHMSNGQAAALLKQLDHGRLRNLVAAHLSEKNNRPELAREALLEAVPDMEDRLSLTSQDRVSGWFEV
ncbi:MBL fold metallo-hydrolase [Solemya velesiana gill symbiont]|uniref:MBL fold metallo-hydrolase n=1 Tax=Solemya velesiana gill symbiont TaxID=1918948 RepID=A0A1T2KV40_9GAMM|nr:MBL fold metallo-hydrolase [Solemya velesiana gill symbiont]OOZ36694.1 MBL fold metallo-hydrolase [Solemya velesiana gill symbiont]